MADAVLQSDPLDAVRAVPGAIARSYLAPEVKVWYMALNKNACTSLKWTVAELAGEDLGTFRAGWNPFIDDTESVHDRKLWKVSPKLDALSEVERRRVHPDLGWFIFAVVRDPRLRLFSAWQNKILMHTPNNQQWSDEDWYPRHPMTADTVIEDFRAFVDFLEADPSSKLRSSDAHFRDQTEMLAEQAVPYSRIYQMSEIPMLLSDLDQHARALGHTRNLYIPRSNPTLLKPIAGVFSNGTQEKIESIYAADFERFGDAWSGFADELAEGAWSDRELNECERQSTLGRRIAELHQMARSQRRRAVEQARRADAAEQLASGRRSSRSPFAPLRSLAQRLVRQGEGHHRRRS